MNNHTTACRYRTSTDKFENHVFKFSNKNEHVSKEPYFKVCSFMTASWYATDQIKKHRKLREKVKKKKE